MHRMNLQIDVLNVARNEKQQSKKCFIDNANLLSGLVKSEDWNRRADGTKNPVNNVIGVPWRMTDGRWTGDRPGIRVPIPVRHCHSDEHDSKGKESPSMTSTSSEPLLEALVATQSKTTNGRKPTQIVAESESQNGSEPLHMEQKDWIEEMK